MRHLETMVGSTRTRRALAGICAGVIVAVASGARAEEPFTYGGDPIHPGCIHALAMQEGDVSPVTVAVSLEGCASSKRSAAKVHYESGDLAVIEDDDLLGGGSFGYRVINQLDNGIIGLAIRRILPDGDERVSLAAVELTERAMVRHGRIVTLRVVEMVGELWIPGMELGSFRAMGNRVHFVAGVGPERVERDFDFTRLGKMRKH